MKIKVLNDRPRKSGKARKNRVQARFDKLRGLIEREEKRNARLAKRLEDLVHRLRTTQHEIDLEALDSHRRLAERLIGFYGRKSLSEWHREELNEWIREVVERVEPVDLEAAAGLKQQMLDALAKRHGMTGDELRDHIREEIESIDEVLCGVDPDDPFAGPFDDHEQPDLFGWDEQPDGFEHEPFADDSEYANESAREPGAADNRAARLTDPGWLRKLFRRAAQALHPDRESDPEKQVEKQGQMQQLLRARKEGDVLTMFALYADAAGDSEIELSELEMNQACDLLKERLDALKADQFEVVDQSPLHTWAHQVFYSPSPAKQEQRLKRWQRECRQDAKQAGRVIGELRNLKVLKQHLQQRRRSSADRFIREIEEIYGGGPFF